MHKFSSVMRLKRIWLRQSTLTLTSPIFQVWLVTGLVVNTSRFWVWSTVLFASIGFLIYWVLLQFIRTFTFGDLADGSFVVRWKIIRRKVVKFHCVYGLNAKNGVLWLETDAKMGTFYNGKIQRYQRPRKVIIPIVYKMNVWNLIITSYQREKDKLRFQAALRENREERRCI